MSIHHESDEQATYTGRHVIDETGQPIGTVTDVVFERATDRPDSSLSDATTTFGETPTWMVVDPGVMRAAHYVPVAGSYRTEEGEIVVPWDRHWVKSAPKAHRDHILEDDLRRQLESHYESSAT